MQAIEWILGKTVLGRLVFQRKTENFSIRCATRSDGDINNKENVRSSGFSECSGEKLYLERCEKNFSIRCATRSDGDIKRTSGRVVFRSRVENFSICCATRSDGDINNKENVRSSGFLEQSGELLDTLHCVALL